MMATEYTRLNDWEDFADDEATSAAPDDAAPGWWVIENAIVYGDGIGKPYAYLHTDEIAALYALAFPDEVK